LRDVQPNGSGPAPPKVIEIRPGTVADVSQDEYVFSLEAIFRVIRRQIWIILLVTVFLTGAVACFSFAQTPTYEASIKILIGQKQDGTATDLGSNVLGLQQLTQTMAAAVNSRPVAKTVIQKMDLRASPEDFLKNVSVSPVANTQFIEVSYTDASPQQAQRIVEEIGQAFSQHVSAVSPNTGGVTTEIWEHAALPQDPVSPDPLRNVVLALMLGVILGVTLAFLRERTDDGWRSPQELEQASGVPNVGFIPTFEPPQDQEAEGLMAVRSQPRRRRARRETSTGTFPDRLVTVADPGSVVSEAYRSLRTNLLRTPEYASAHVIVMTSSNPGEGKSVACANLGAVLAQAGKSTLVMDCDLRRPMVHEIFGLANGLGVADALAEDRSLQEICQERLPGLELATAGPPHPYYADLLGSERFEELLDQARGAFDYVLVDTPPTRPVSDALTIATLSDGVLLVVDSRNTGKAAVRLAVDHLRAVGANPLGTVAGNVEALGTDESYGYY
jgi:capsular exopolysaccharide synthesis family protein